MRLISASALLAGLLLALPACAAQGSKIRVGHFPNVTHAQALVAHALSRSGKGWFEPRLGREVEIEWFTYKRRALRHGGNVRRVARPHVHRPKPGT